jgi:FAD/FMN-containing dehydrogenase
MVNRRIEDAVSELGGHKSLYSEAFYDEQTFARLYATHHLEELRRTTDPDARLTSLYDKAVHRR